MIRLAFVLLAVALTTRANAIEVLHTEVAHAHGRYQIDFDVRIDSPTAVVRALMTDYDRLARLSDLVVESRVSDAAPNGARRIDILLRGCILFVCKTVRKVEDVTVESNGDIVTRAVPGAGDFTFSEERWAIATQEDVTRVRYTGVMEPAFFVPPLIGPPILKRHIKKRLIETVRNIEQLAGHP